VKCPLDSRCGQRAFCLLGRRPLLGNPGSLEMIDRSRRRSQSVIGTPVASARRAGVLMGDEGRGMVTVGSRITVRLEPDRLGRVGCGDRRGR
jgi:hypothetical protein